MPEKQNLTQSFSPYYVGTAITLLYIMFLALLFIGFSAYITRTSIDNSDLENKLIDELIYSNEQDLQLDQKISQLNEKIAGIQRDYDKIPNSLALVEKEMFLENIKVHDLVSLKISRLVDTIDISADSNLRNFFREELETHIGIENSQFIEYPKIRQILANFRLRPYGPNDDKETALKIVSELSNDLAEYSRTFTLLESQYREILTENNTLEIVLENAKLELEELERVSDVFQKAVTLRHKSIIASLELPADILLRFVKMPTIILTLIVTIAAGGLGSLAAFTRKFVRRDKAAISSRLFANVAEGIVASIAIFLFAGTGMLMLTQGGGGQDGNVELSPYMVAFIAFLSGFMAENAFEKIEEAGRKFFKTADRSNDNENAGNQGGNSGNQNNNNNDSHNNNTENQGDNSDSHDNNNVADRPANQGSQ